MQSGSIPQTILKYSSVIDMCGTFVRELHISPNFEIGGKRDYNIVLLHWSSTRWPARILCRVENELKKMQNNSARSQHPCVTLRDVTLMVLPRERKREKLFENPLHCEKYLKHSDYDLTSFSGQWNNLLTTTASLRRQSPRYVPPSLRSLPKPK